MTVLRWTATGDDYIKNSLSAKEVIEVRTYIKASRTAKRFILADENIPRVAKPFRCMHFKPFPPWMLLHFGMSYVCVCVWIEIIYIKKGGGFEIM